MEVVSFLANVLPAVQSVDIGLGQGVVRLHLEPGFSLTGPLLGFKSKAWT